MTNAPNAITKAEFARLNGWSRSYVSKLASAGRLVVNDAGLVLVAESSERIRATTEAPERASRPALAPQYRSDRDRKDFYDAELARLDLEQRAGKLLVASDVIAAVADAGTLYRQRLEGWPHRLAPQIAALGGDLRRIRELIDAESGTLLADVGQRLSKATVPRV